MNGRLHLALDEGLVSVPDRQHPARSPVALIGIFLKQAWHEARVRHWRKVPFRSRRNEDACRAYTSLDPWEFEGVNQRQAWANWRTIPRNLAGRVPARALHAIDLCCGTGCSTEVLAYHLTPGSAILGVDYNPRFVAAARARTYLTRSGAAARVSFRAQSVLETLRDAAGEVVPSGSVDLVNASGAVGCHFEVPATARLAAEIDRVLRPGALALIDSGHDGTSEDQLRKIFEARDFQVIHRARSCLFDRYPQLCFRKP